MRRSVELNKNKNVISVPALMALVVISCSAAWAGTVAAGCDDLTTNPATSFDFTSLSSGQVGVVHFTSNPVGAGPGNTDTVVCRLQDATINAGHAPQSLMPTQIAALPNAINIQITALSMESTGPVNVGGNFFNVFVSLDPANLANDTGKMAIYAAEPDWGTFTSFFSVFFEARFVDNSNPALNFNAFSSIVLEPFTSVGNGVGTWSPTTKILVLPGCMAEGPPGSAPGNNDHVPCGATDSNNHGVVGDFNPGATPEPASIWLMGAGLLGVVMFMCCRRLRPGA